MEGSSSQPSSSNLLCREDKSYLNEGDEQNQETQFQNSQLVPYYQDLDSEDDYYLQMLVRREINSSSNSSSNFPSWLKNSRALAINWILNDHQPWAVTLLGVACLSLAAKMDECKVPALSEYQVPDFEFERNVMQNMELLVLTTLEWNMTLSTPFVYLNYYASKLDDQNVDRLISRGTQLVMGFIKESNSVGDYYPFVVAAAAVVAAIDWQLTQEALKLRISTVSLWQTSDDRLCSKENPSTPNLTTEVEQTTTDKPSTSGTKRKLTFRDSDQNPDLPD
uniref:Cyclin N-terminal domain-containing protein n=1 Tax=Chenopodium quinoa TaxID=63459 RepID=A0A803N4D3_CHEQI